MPVSDELQSAADEILSLDDPVSKCGYYDKVTTVCDCFEMDCCWDFCPYERLEQCPVHNARLEK